ncbi:MAG: ABC transporter ATP-binding protein [Patescibacteria group bacterium]|jgi:ATP-binding cassette subfamily B protein
MPTTAKNNISDANKKSNYWRDFSAISRAARITIRRYWRASPWYAAGYLLCALIVSVLPIITAWYTGRLVDELITAYQTPDVLFSWNLTIIVAGLFIFSSLIGQINNYFNINVFYKFSLMLEQDVNTKFAYLDDEYYEDPETNNLIQKVKENYGGAPVRFINNLHNLMRYSVQIISSIGVVIVFSPILVGLMILATLPQFINGIVCGRQKWSIWAAKGEVRRDYSNSRMYINTIPLVQETRVYRIREFLIKRVTRLLHVFQQAQLRVENKRIWLGSMLELLSGGSFAAALLFLVNNVLRGVISVGKFSFYLSAIRQTQSALAGFFQASSIIYEDGLYMVDVYNFLQLQPKIIPGKIKLPSTISAPLIEFKNISFKYPSSQVSVLKNFNLTIQPGEHLAIVGENGAGKTTLIKLLLRFYDVDAGQILINGHDITKLDLDSWYKLVGVLFQEFNHYHFDAKTNIEMGDIHKPKRSMDAVIAAAKASGAHSFIEQYPHGYKQILSRAFKEGTRPSVGQWQRIALARAFFKNAPSLILDEPTSAIDPRAEFEIFERLFEFTKGKTVIIISHRFSTVRNAQRIIVLDQGKIIEEGSHESLMQKEGSKYKLAFELQRKGYV